MDLRETDSPLERLLVLPPTAASSLRVAGLTVLQRILLAAQRAGFSQIVVWNPEPNQEVVAALRRDARTCRVRLCSELPAGDDFWVVVPADIVVSAQVFEKIRTRSSATVTRWCVGDVVAAVSGPFPRLRVAVENGRQRGWQALVRLAAHTETLDGEVAVPVADEHALPRAEAALCAKIRRDAAATDGVLAHWVDRHVSLAISRRLARIRWLRPNHVTACGTAVGLASAWLFSQGTFAAGLWGALLFWFACVIDGCDGELARLTFRDSRWGKVFDVTTDNVVHAAIFVGLGLGYQRSHPSAPHAGLLLLLLGGLVCAALASFVFLNSETANSREFSQGVGWRARVGRSVAALMNRDFAYLLLVLALVNRLHWFLWGAALGSYAVAAVALALALPRQRNEHGLESKLGQEKLPRSAGLVEDAGIEVVRRWK